MPPMSTPLRRCQRLLAQRRAISVPCRAISTSAPRLGEFSDVLRFATIQPEDGQLTRKDLSRKALLVVNTASRCGYTPQLAGLQKLHETFSGRGLVVLAVPSNDFGGQEPGDAAEIRQLYSSPKYGVSFPIAEKAVVTGEDAHPFFLRIVEEYSRSVAPTWNFDKFLLDHHGDLRAVFPHDTEPLVPQVLEAIEEVLADLPKDSVSDQAALGEEEDGDEEEGEEEEEEEEEEGEGGGQDEKEKQRQK